jgi:hypothetical protein
LGGVDSARQGAAGRLDADGHQVQYRATVGVDLDYFDVQSPSRPNSRVVSLFTLGAFG